MTRKEFIDWLDSLPVEDHEAQGHMIKVAGTVAYIIKKRWADDNTIVFKIREYTSSDWLFLEVKPRRIYIYYYIGSCTMECYVPFNKVSMIPKKEVSNV